MSTTNDTSTPTQSAASDTSAPSPTTSADTTTPSSSSPITDSSSSSSGSPTDTPTPTPTPSTTPTTAPPVTTPTSSTTSTTAPPETTPSTTSSSSSSETSTTSSSITPTTSSSSITPTTSSSTTSATPTTVTRVSTAPEGSTFTVVTTSTELPSSASFTTSSSTSSSTSASGTASIQSGSKATSGGLSTGGTIAVAVVVPIVAVALLVLAGIFFWRKRKARKDAEELRRKEVEEYGYNPNNDPTLPAVGAGGPVDGPYEMREDGASGYRGWGTTAVASSGRKASTTLSGGQSAAGIGMAYSEGTSPTHAPGSDTRSENLLMDGRPISGEQEPLGAMGPAASGNRSGDINRGISNASSSYSAANRSDGSGEMPGGAYYNNQYDTGNPYSDTPYGSPPGRAEMSGQPVIRDVQARRNTRIENPSHFPQQSAGISQNF